MTIQHLAMVFDAGGLNSSEKALLLAYCNHTDAHGYCWPGVERLADEAGMSERTVQRTNNLLRERNLIKSIHRANPKTGEQISNLTRVNLPLLASMRRPARDYGDNLIEEITFDADDADDSFAQVRAGCQSVTPRGDTLTPPPRQSGTPRGVNLAPKPSVEPLVEPPPPSPPESHPPQSERHGEEEAMPSAHKTAVTLVDQATSRWVGHRRPTRSERVRLAERVTEALAEGASPDGVIQALTRDLRPNQVRTTAVQVVMGRTNQPGWADIVPAPRLPTPVEQAEQCPRHPGAARRVGGECAGCWADRTVISDDDRADAFTA